jgi:hypothetical protein
LGLWRVTEIQNLDTGEVQAERNEYHMYTASHEMIVLAGKDRPKIEKSIADMTVDEVMSQQPIGARRQTVAHEYRRLVGPLRGARVRDRV